MRVPLKGIASATKTLADGTRRRYLYAWRGGPLLKRPDGTPIADRADPHLHVAFADAHRERIKTTSTGTMATLVTEFRASSEYKTKAQKTRSAYDRYLRKIEERFGEMPLTVVEDRRTRGDFKAWRSTFADKPRTADYVWQTLARVLSVAKDNGRISTNVCERGGRLYSSDRAEIIWTEGDIAAIMKVASEPIKLAFVLGLWTGQREGDLLRLSWNAYDGHFLTLRQSKRQKRVKIPVGDALRRELDAANRAKRTTTILANTRGKP